MIKTEIQLERAKKLIGKTVTSCSVTSLGHVLLFFDDGTAAVFEGLKPFDKKDRRLISGDSSAEIGSVIDQYQQMGWDSTQVIYDKLASKYYVILEKGED